MTISYVVLGTEISLRSAAKLESIGGGQGCLSVTVLAIAKPNIANVSKPS